MVKRKLFSGETFDVVPDTLVDLRYLFNLEFNLIGSNWKFNDYDLSVNVKIFTIKGSFELTELEMERQIWARERNSEKKIKWK